MLLFYSPGACSLAEIILFQWLDQPHRLCRVSRDERKGPVYRAAVNAHGQVPVLVEGDRVLTENAAILLLLGDRHPRAGMLPASGTPARYDLYRWLSWLDSGFHGAHSPVFAPQRFHPDESEHDRVRGLARDTVRGQVAILDAHLADRSHVLFDHRNLLDAYVFAMARWSEESLDYAQNFPHVARFLAEMRTDPGVAAALSIESGDLDSGGPLRGHVAWADALDDAGRLRADLGR
jgi:glutathione S-transferase